MLQDKTLDKIRDVIIEPVHPDKIILFGSRATGKNRDDSDYDIFVIKSGIINERKVSTEIYMAFYDNEIGLPIDVITSNPEKFDKNKDNPNMVYYDVVTQGVTIYG